MSGPDDIEMRLLEHWDGVPEDLAAIALWCGTDHPHPSNGCHPYQPLVTLP